MTCMKRQAAPLAAMLADIHQAAVSTIEGRPERVAAAIQAHVQHPDLLSRLSCPSCPDNYIRHLLHADVEGRYAVVALVWRPGQMSPVHAHRTWCALGIHSGVLSEAFYELPEDNLKPRQTRMLLREEGRTSSGPADPRLIHRLANLGTTEAVSIHVYGASFDRFGQDVNQVF
jgi:predicted metal-dependent enzyme (double-stranded beta helix superfamily)